MFPGTELLIVRHGEGHCNVENRLSGIHSCRGLTERGRGQVTRLAAHLKQRFHEQTPGIAAIVASPVPRAAETAAVLGETLAAPVESDRDLRERDYGDADGQTWPAALAEFGGIPLLHPDRPIGNNGETWTEYLTRSRRSISRILEAFRGRRVLVVGHGDTVTAAFAVLLGLKTGFESQVGFAVDQASLTYWRVQPLVLSSPCHDWRWVLVQHNDTSYLDTESENLRNSPFSDAPFG